MRAPNPDFESFLSPAAAGLLDVMILIKNSVVRNDFLVCINGK